VHLGAGDIPLNRYLVEIALPRRAWDSAAVLRPAQLVGWDALPHSKTSMDWGTIPQVRVQTVNIKAPPSRPQHDLCRRTLALIKIHKRLRPVL
jgi:hypothetical protein